MVSFEDLLKNSGFGKVGDNAMDNKIVADCIDNYLNYNSGIGSFDINKSIIILEKSGVNVRHLAHNINSINPITYVCATMANVFIKTSSKFNYRYLNDAIAWFADHVEDEVHVTLVSEKTRIARSSVYFRNEDSLREYLSTRTRHVRTAYHFEFSSEPFETEKL